MCRIVEEIVENEKTKDRIEIALRMLAKKTYSIKEIAEIAGLDEAVVEELAKKTSA